MAVAKKGMIVGSRVLYDTHLIFSRVIALQASSREVNVRDVLSYELAPNALFGDSGKYIIICINYYLIIYMYLSMWADLCFYHL